jgi:hypothetical protein
MASAAYTEATGLVRSRKSPPRRNREVATNLKCGFVDPRNGSKSKQARDKFLLHVDDEHQRRRSSIRSRAVSAIHAHSERQRVVKLLRRTLPLLQQMLQTGGWIVCR